MNRMESKENAFGKVSSLRLTASARAGKTYLREIGFTAPFKVMTPFPGEDGSSRVMILTASAGIMEGDIQEIAIRTESGARLECTSQAYEKVHRMEGGHAVRRTCVHVGRDSLLVYRPLPVIPFAESAFENVTDIELEDGSSRLIWQEIMCCGRVARGEIHRYRYYHSLIRVRERGCLIYRENCRFHPMEQPMESVGMFEGYTHMASVIFVNWPADSQGIDRIRTAIEDMDGICGGVSLTAHGDAVVRMFAGQGQRLLEACDKINDKINIFYP